MKGWNRAAAGRRAATVRTEASAASVAIAASAASAAHSAVNVVSAVLDPAVVSAETGTNAATAGIVRRVVHARRIAASDR